MGNDGLKMKTVIGKKQQVMLPLLHVLKSIKPAHRIIILAHLDDKTRDALYATIMRVLQSSKVPLETRLKLKSQLKKYQKDLRYLADRSKSDRVKKRKLVALGGSPMRQVLNTAIPLLMNMFP